MQKLLLTFGIILASLLLGYAVQKLAAAGRLGLPADLGPLRRRMQMLALFGCIPASAMLSLWGLPAPDPRLLLLPLLGLCAWTVGGLLGVGFSRCLGLGRRQTGSMFCCGAFTNIGSMGGLVCVLFLGEQSIALLTLYRLCEELFFFGVAYPVARQYGMQGGHVSPWAVVRQVVTDPMLRVVFCALLLGVALNMLGVPRFPGAGDLASGCVVVATVLFLSAIGMSLRLARLGNYTRQWSCIALIKFLLCPLLITGLAWLLGLGQVDGGLPLRTVLVLSAMPVAMNALVPPSLFKLDLDLANTCWICTTAALLVVLPLLLFLLPHI